MYIITGAKKFSYYFAILLISYLTVVILNGVNELLGGVFMPMAMLTPIFKFPISIITTLALAFYNLKQIPMHLLQVVNSMNTKYVKLLVFLLGALLLYGFKWGQGKFFL